MLPASFQGRLRLPVIAAPMFLVSGPELAIAACRAGVVGTIQSLNQRTSEGFEDWLVLIKAALEAAQAISPRTPIAPYGVNLIVHRSNARAEADLALCVKHKVPLVITSLGAVPEVVQEVHRYGGLVFHDVIDVRQARKAAQAGVDGLILVCAGGGGHAGTLSPFALLPEVRRFFHGTIVLAGALSDGRAVAAARMLGADIAYMGTRFIVTRESRADDAFKWMVLHSTAADIVYTPAVSGVNGNFLRASLVAAGFDPDNMPTTKPKMNIGQEQEMKAWKHIWSAGQGCGQIDDIPSVDELVDRLEREYHAAIQEFGDPVRRAAAQ